MRYDRLFTKLFCTPLLLEAGVRTGFERVLLAFMNGQPSPLPKLAEDHPQFFAKKQDQVRADRYTDNIMEVNGDTAIIHIDGAIDRNLSAWDRLCFDACDLNDVNNALSRVESDGSIKNLLLAINSPGGGVSGVPETAARIQALSSKKNTKALIDGMGCSAAAWLANGCTEVFATPSSMCGSIGVYLALLDQSRYLENMGIHVETVKDGALKAAGASWKPLTDDERSHFQNQVNQIGAMFRSAMTANRDISPDAMQGQSFFGQSALDEGIVDALLPDLSTALKQF